jgi:sugar lactone lactonase YvrE
MSVPAWRLGIALALALAGRVDAQLQPRPTHEAVIRRLEPRFDRLVLEKIVDDHDWVERPVWITLDLLTRELSAPNGIAFAPDERTLYVSNADRERLVWLAFPVEPDGTLGPSRVLYDGTRSTAGRRGVADGMKVDVHGNIFGAGPGGVYVMDPLGTLLGWFDFGGNVGNLAWGEDGSTLFIAANSAV